MRLVKALIILFITSGVISYMRTKGVVISNDASLISMAIVFAGAFAGGD